MTRILCQSPIASACLNNAAELMGSTEGPYLNIDCQSREEGREYRLNSPEQVSRLSSLQDMMATIMASGVASVQYYFDKAEAQAALRDGYGVFYRIQDKTYYSRDPEGKLPEADMFSKEFLKGVEFCLHYVAGQVLVQTKDAQPFTKVKSGKWSTPSIISMEDFPILRLLVKCLELDVFHVKLLSNGKTKELAIREVNLSPTLQPHLMKMYGDRLRDTARNL